ncbi:MAG: hypothetical protein JJU36_02395 [Phycisphaeraceae bacterium]|nr:hypothetical protein [Phycisphaeraceae bacterium]
MPDDSAAMPALGVFRWFSVAVLGPAVLAMTVLSSPAWSATPKPEVSAPRNPLQPADLSAHLKAGTLDRLAADAQAILAGLLAKPQLQEADHGRLILASAIRQYVRHFGDIAASDDYSFDDVRAELAWLASRRELWVPLALAMSEHDEPVEALRILGLLRREHEQSVVAFPELTVAFMIVWDQPPDMNMDDQDRDRHMVALFDHYTSGRRPMRVNLRDLPWELAIYLANGRADVQELRWAHQRYSNRPANQIGEVYFDVPYDKAGLYYGEWQGIGGEPYTLPNLVQHGGVCKDQAHFAKHVSLSVGIPAVLAHGKSGRGVGYHCWIGYIGPAGGNTAWDFNTARYPEQRYWSAMVVDPQTRREVTDADVSLRSQLWHTSAEQRRISLALLRAADIQEGDDRIRWLKKAIDASPGNHGAWLALADDIGDMADSRSEMNEVIRILRQFAIGRYDEFAYELLVRMFRSIEPEERVRMISVQMRMFERRPDLTARMRMAQGDAFAEMERHDQAISIWSQVATRNVSQPAIVLDATDRIDAVLRRLDQKQRLSILYRTIWSAMAAPDISGYAWTTPWFLIGQRYATVLEEIGDTRTAEQVRSRLSERDSRRDRARENVERPVSDQPRGG